MFFLLLPSINHSQILHPPLKVSVALMYILQNINNVPKSLIRCHVMHPQNTIYICLLNCSTVIIMIIIISINNFISILKNFQLEILLYGQLQYTTYKIQNYSLQRSIILSKTFDRLLFYQRREAGFIDEAFLFSVQCEKANLKIAN